MRFRSALPGNAWPAVGNDTGTHLQALLFQLDRSQWLAPPQLQALQLQQLGLLLEHARRTVPHYARSLKGLDLARLDRAGLEQLPLLTRKEMQSDFEALKSSALPAGHGKPMPWQTSGSTGQPIRFLRTGLTQLLWNAMALRDHLWHERDFSAKLAAIRANAEDKHWPDWGSPVSAVFESGPAATLNAKHPLERQLDWLLQEDPDYLITHASNLAALARASLQRGTPLTKLRQARSFGEALRPDTRATVRAAWGVDVSDTYTCEEAGYIALQCPKHEHYHVMAESLLVEVLDDAGRPCAPGETGRVVLTTLHNFAYPLIRYVLGDYAEVGAACECGRGLPVLTQIHGRQRNMLQLPDGSQHWPSFPAQLWQDVAAIEQFQLVQKTPSSIEVRYVMKRDLSTAEQVALAAALAGKLGYAFEFAWLRMPEIKRSANLKFEDFISEL